MPQHPTSQIGATPTSVENGNYRHRAPFLLFLAEKACKRVRDVANAAGLCKMPAVKDFQVFGVSGAWIPKLNVEGSNPFTRFST